MTESAQRQAHKDRQAKLDYDKWFASLSKKQQYEHRDLKEYVTDYQMQGTKAEATETEIVECFDAVKDEIEKFQFNGIKDPLGSSLRLFAADLPDSFYADCFRYATGLITDNLSQQEIGIRWHVSRAAACKEIMRIQKRFKLSHRPQQRKLETRKKYAQRQITVHLNSQRAFC